MKAQNTLVIFGAPDHEEKLARKIAALAGCMTGTACTRDMKPVHAGNAYNSGNLTYSADQYGHGLKVLEKVIVFECGIESATTQGIDRDIVTVCDHHNPGDPGYNSLPDYYWIGSSLGQLCKELNLSKTTIISMLQEVDENLSVEGAWKLLSYTAAGDHCPAAAYAGKCTGIDPINFMHFRLRQKLDESLHPDEYEDQYTRLIYQIDRAVDLLKKHGTNSESTADLREYGEIEQLPEAAMMVGKAYIAKIPELGRDGEPTGKDKIVFGGDTTPDEVEAFMAWAKTLVNRVGEPYGNPTRGYAGVVVMRPWCPTCFAEWNCTNKGACPKCGTVYPDESLVG